MRIACLITDLEIGGTERVLERLVTNLSPGFEPLVISMMGEGPIAERLRPRVPVVELKMRGKLDASVMPKAAATLREFRPDVLHTFLFHANVLGRIVGSLAPVPKTVCSLRTLEGKAYHAPVQRFTWRGFDRVVCASRAVAEHARRRMGIRGARVIHNGVPLPSNRGGIKEELGLAPLVATSVRMAKGKGAREFVGLAARIPEAHFVLIGGGAEEADLRRIAGPNVRFAGWRDDAAALLVDADVFVHASRLGEGFPNAVAEAMAAGCAVVATDAGGTREVVGDAGVVTDDLEPAVRALLADGARRRALGRAARDRAERFFSIAAMVRAYEDLYREMIP
ncbi:MAG: glycosyltransferase [Planctomycetes bacterium]|nr:glycosyltransferase [Planctomycetota bacterium]